MPGKRVLPTAPANFHGDYAEGLGQYRTGAFSAPMGGKEEVQVLAGCLASEAREAVNQTIKRIVRIT